jgi:hypothetical protein
MTQPTKATLTEQERRAHQRLQAELLAYLEAQRASPEQTAQSAYVQAITAFAAVQAVLELLRDRQLIAPEALSRLIADRYDAMANELARQPRIALGRPT